MRPNFWTNYRVLYAPILPSRHHRCKTERGPLANSKAGCHFPCRRLGDLPFDKTVCRDLAAPWCRRSPPNFAGLGDLPDFINEAKAVCDLQMLRVGNRE